MVDALGIREIKSSFMSMDRRFVEGLEGRDKTVLCDWYKSLVERERKLDYIDV